MKIRIGYEIGYESAERTPMLLMLSVHPSRQPDLLLPHRLDFDPPIPATGYRDCYGNICTRIVAPEGRLTISADMIVADPGTPDIIELQAPQHPVEYLPEEALLFLLVAGIARRTGYRMSLGRCSAPFRRVGPGCRRS